ncbi:MAG TPA: hypothetical protein VGC82_03350, partial [Rhodopila sp.]
FRHCRNSSDAAASPPDTTACPGFCPCYLKVGLFINTQYSRDVDVPAQIPALVQQVKVARDAELASLWFPHHWLTKPMQMQRIMPVMTYFASWRGPLHHAQPVPGLEQEKVLGSLRRFGEAVIPE